MFTWIFPSTQPFTELHTFDLSDLAAFVKPRAAFCSTNLRKNWKSKPSGVAVNPMAIPNICQFKVHRSHVCG
jgi:hypothetical protein